MAVLFFQEKNFLFLGSVNFILAAGLFFLYSGFGAKARGRYFALFSLWTLVLAFLWFPFWLLDFLVLISLLAVNYFLSRLGEVGFWPFLGAVFLSSLLFRAAIGLLHNWPILNWFAALSAVLAAIFAALLFLAFNSYRI